MKLPSPSLLRPRGRRLPGRGAGAHAGRSRAGFTLVEIAIAIGVIGFAMVAIIGILPTGLQVQRDNRTETVLNQDATFWMEAIRNGARGPADLTRYVDRIEFVDRELGTATNVVFGSSAEIIGLLTTPAVETNLDVYAYVWALSGSASEKAQNVASKEISLDRKSVV